MSPEFPTFFGVPGIELQKQFDFKKDGFNLNWWRIIEHGGTHLDAPIHFSEVGRTADKIAAGDLVVPLAVIDVRRRRGSGSGLSRDAPGPRRLGTALSPASGQLLRRHAVRLGASMSAMRPSTPARMLAARFIFRVSRRRRPNGCCGTAGSSGLRSIRCRSTTVRRRTSRPMRVAPRRPMGSGECRQSGQGAARRVRRSWSALPRSRTRPVDPHG